MKRIYLIILLAATLAACHNSTRRDDAKADTIAMAPCPVFEADSAYAKVVAQCDFGPRVPGSAAWSKCGNWIVEQFQALGLEVTEQKTEVEVFDGTNVPCRNIIASLNPDNKDRILLCAHWDSRPWADNDPNEKNHHTPVLAANDGASGVAMLMELARVLSMDKTGFKTGVDIICFDVEDMGTPQWADESASSENTWCLGSLYWANQAVSNGYRARFGVLFDMVGGRGSSFMMEGFSKTYAEPVAQMLWHIGRQIGYNQYFPLRDGGYVTDDHLNVNRIAEIPCIDIIPHFEEGPSGFGPTWHTVSDTPENIDTKVLKAVGQSVLQMLYNDNAE